MEVTSMVAVHNDESTEQHNFSTYLSRISRPCRSVFGLDGWEVDVVLPALPLLAEADDFLDLAVPLAMGGCSIDFWLDLRSCYRGSPVTTRRIGG